MIFTDIHIWASSLMHMCDDSNENYSTENTLVSEVLIYFPKTALCLCFAAQRRLRKRKKTSRVYIYILRRSTFLWCCLLCTKRWCKLLSLRMKSLSVPFKWQLSDSVFRVVMFITLHKVILTFESVHGWNPNVWQLSALSCGAVSVMLIWFTRSF